jgi:hypothetical protein
MKAFISSGLLLIAGGVICGGGAGVDAVTFRPAAPALTTSSAHWWKNEQV